MLMSLKKTGARSARARTRGQNPLVDVEFIIEFLSNGQCTFMRIHFHIFQASMIPGKVEVEGTPIISQVG
jgi:hypothetical protein